MNNDVIISIDSFHRMHDGEDSHINEKYEGQYFLKSGMHYILYDSIDEESKERVSNTIKFNEEKMTLVKKGGTRTTLYFSLNQCHKSDYVTPFGIFGLETNTTKYATKFEAEKMGINLEYELYLNEQLSSVCTMNIEVISTCLLK